MDKKIFFVTFGVAFTIGLAVGLLLACSTVASAVHPNTIVAYKALERVEEPKDSISLSQAIKLANAYRDMLKSYYHYKDYEEYDFITDTYEGRYTFWDDCISETDAYDTANEILQGDWGDFFDE
jgi:hypothetical protein